LSGQFTEQKGVKSRSQQIKHSVAHSSSVTTSELFKSKKNVKNVKDFKTRISRPGLHSIWKNAIFPQKSWSYARISILSRLFLESTDQLDWFPILQITVATNIIESVIFLHVHQKIDAS
jgi:hypothetical protein